MSWATDRVPYSHWRDASGTRGSAGPAASSRCCVSSHRAPEYSRWQRSTRPTESLRPSSTSQVDRRFEVICHVRALRGFFSGASVVRLKLPQYGLRELATLLTATAIAFSLTSLGVLPEESLVSTLALGSVVITFAYAFWIGVAPAERFAITVLWLSFILSKIVGLWALTLDDSFSATDATLGKLETCLYLMRSLCWLMLFSAILAAAHAINRCRRAKRSFLPF